MKEHLREKGCSDRVLVLDTAAFLAGLQLYFSNECLYTTPDVLEEVKDHESKEKLEMAISLGRIIVLEPRETINIERKVRKRLSDTDISVIKLSLYLKRTGKDVVVVTDDYTLQKVLKEFGLEYMSVKTIGVDKADKLKKRTSGH